MAGAGVTHVLEIGPGRVLTGLVSRIERAIQRANLDGAAALDEAVAFARG
jgi:[acyl-carrier-protein] S-malonyltransferase